MGKQENSASPVITFTSDYGIRDHFAGVVKGVIHSLAPGVPVIDITHEIDPFDVARGAFVLRQAWSYFPEGSVHLVVVDPGVGSNRQIVAGKFGGRYFVGPDNGLLTFVNHDLPAEALHLVENPRYFLSRVSASFHGRDIMGPVAAHLAGGLALGELGRRIDRLEVLPMDHEAAMDGPYLRASVICRDRYGNVITNATEQQVSMMSQRYGTVTVSVNGRHLGPLVSTFSEIGLCDVGAMVGSSGFVEVFMNQGRADRELGEIGVEGIELQFGLY